MHTLIQLLRNLIQRFVGRSHPTDAVEEPQPPPSPEPGPTVEEHETTSESDPGTSTIPEAAAAFLGNITAQPDLPPASVPWHILSQAPARRSVSTGVAGETFQEMVFTGADRFVRLRNYSGAIDDTGPVWTMDITRVKPVHLPPREQRNRESKEVDWDVLFAITGVDDWEEFCAHFFPGHLGHIAAYLPFAFSREETPEVFSAILRRLLEEGRLVHAQPGKTINELRRSPARPLPLWAASSEVAANCYRLYWPDVEHVDYINVMTSYCAWYMQFAWVAWNEQILVAHGLAEEHRPGGLWYDSSEYAKAGEWALLPRNEDAAPVVGLALQRHLRRLGFDSVDALARYHFGFPFDQLLRGLQLETLPRTEVQDFVLELLHLLLHRGWLVHADPKVPWPRQFWQGEKPLRRWQATAQDIVDCLRVLWPYTLSREPERCPYFLCDLFDFAKRFSFAWVAKGRHRGKWAEEANDTPGSLWYDSVEIAKPGEWV